MEMIGFDTCLEGFIEVAYQLRDSGPKIMIASQYQESSSGEIESASWPYAVIFRQFNQSNGDMSAASLASLICDEFIKSFRNQTQTNTLAAVDLRKLDALTETVAAFADAMAADHTDTENVKQHAEAVKRAVKETVIHYATTLALKGKVFGLNINFPTEKSSSYYKSYDPLIVSFPVPSHWKSFLTAYMDNMKGSWIEAARLAAHGGLVADSADLYNFCDQLSPGGDEVRLSVQARGNGQVAPQEACFVKKGVEMDVLAVPNHDSAMPPVTHFVRWFKSGDASLKDPYAAETSLTPNGDTLLTAVFSENLDSYTVEFQAEGNGSIAGPLLQQVASGGSSAAVTAVPQAGYSFLGWGGDYDGTENPLAIANVQMNMSVYALFGLPSEVGAKRLNFNFDKAARKGDRMAITDADYPGAAIPEVASAAVLINGLRFDCPAGANWTSPKAGIYLYQSPKKAAPDICLRIDTNKLRWSFSVDKADVNAQLVPQDGLKIILQVNGVDTAKLNLDYGSLGFKSQTSYKRH